MKTPWNSIAESIVAIDRQKKITAAQAMESPCLTCPTTPCCNRLPLNTFKITNLVELDHAVYLLNFNLIELAVSASGDWSCYYTYACRFLDRKTNKCKVHSTEDQPRICFYYNPYNCWYQRNFTVGQSEELIRIDAPRLQHLMQYIELNEQRQIVSVPAWDDLIQLMERFEDKKPDKTIEPDLNDSALAQWESMLKQSVMPDAPELEISAYDPKLDPCVGCEAYCCKALVFPQAYPRTISNLDYFRFALGFPGIELGIGDGGWSIIVKTTCRYLDDQNQCSVFGKPNRPLICRFYDAWKCDYKSQFGQTRPNGFMRIKFEQFSWLAESLSFNAEGNIAEVHDTETIRTRIEARWKEYFEENN